MRKPKDKTYCNHSQQEYMIKIRPSPAVAYR